MILGRDKLTELALNPKRYEHFIEGGERPLKWYTSLVVDLGA